MNVFFMKKTKISWEEIRGSKVIEFLYVCQNLGWTVYAGPMIAFAVLSYIHPHFYTPFSHFGVGFGLSLTLWIYSTIGIQYLSEGHFFPSLTDNPWLIAAFVMWISNIKLEIWTLDPIRKHKEAILPQKHMRSLRAHLSVHALLIALVEILFALEHAVVT